MTAFEEICQITTKLGLSMISKSAPHGRWRIDILLPEGANITGTKGSGDGSDLSICEVDADTPEEAFITAATSLKERLKTVNDRIMQRRTAK